MSVSWVNLFLFEKIVLLPSTGTQMVGGQHLITLNINELVFDFDVLSQLYFCLNVSSRLSVSIELKRDGGVNISHFLAENPLNCSSITN